MKKRKPTPIGPVTDTGKEESDSDIDMTERESSDVEMKEAKCQRGPRRKDRKTKSSKDFQESESCRASSRNSSESKKKRERNNEDETF